MPSALNAETGDIAAVLVGTPAPMMSCMNPLDSVGVSVAFGVPAMVGDRDVTEKEPFGPEKFRLSGRAGDGALGSIEGAVTLA